MTKKEPPSPQPIPSTDAETRDALVDSMETTLVELETRASTTTTVLQEILAHGDERRYVNHWGINE